jgi:hypothetical protein
MALPAPVHHLEAKVGGKFKMSFRNFTTGTGHSFGGEFVELVPDDPNLPGEIQVTVTLKTVSIGTEINIVQEGLPGRHSAGGLLSRLAAIVAKLGKARRTRNHSIAHQNQLLPPGSTVALPAGCRARFAVCS